jgi:hypothetical protein
MDGLRRQQVTAQDAFYHDYVFEDVLTFAGPRVSGAQSMTYLALWRVRPPVQRPFDAPATLRHLAHVADLPCFGSPHRHKSLGRQAGQRKCLLEGW